MAYRKFNYSQPTQLILSSTVDQDLDNLLKPFKRILILYSSNFIKELGIYDDIYRIIERYSINVFEIPNCRPNPSTDFLSQKIDSVADFYPELILAIGGGSVIDLAKAISLNLENREDFVEKLLDKKMCAAKTPIGTILTLPAAGSESNSSFVLHINEDLGKIARADLSVRPLFAILNPEYTLSLSKKALHCSISDILCHLLEQLFAAEDNTSFIDQLIIAAIKNLFMQIRILNSDFLNIDARANIMLNANFSLSYYLSFGRSCDWLVHTIEHAISGIYGSNHGEGLSIVFPIFLEHMKEHVLIKGKLELLGRELFGYDDDVVSRTIASFDELFTSLGLSRNLMELTSSKVLPSKLIKVIYKNQNSIGRNVDLGMDDCLQILEKCLVRGTK